MDKIVYEGAIDNNHLMKVFFWKYFQREDKEEEKYFPTQEAKLEHRIQPETESMIKMILETPFVVSQS